MALRVSLLFSPRPAALVVRRVFASGGARAAELLDRHAPDDVVALVDERYGEDAPADLRCLVLACGPHDLAVRLSERLSRLGGRAALVSQP